MDGLLSEHLQLEPESIGGIDEREYQHKGTEFLQAIRRAFLCDDPGLGKTFQALKAAELPVQVNCPLYLTGQWEDSILQIYPEAVIARADGTRKQREITVSKKADFYVMNYAMLKSYDMPGDIKTYINDEAHHLRNHRALHSKSASIIENTDPKARIYHLTATPFWKVVSDIWMPLHILYPMIFTSYRDFIKLYCSTIRSPYGLKVVGIKPRMRADLKRLLQPIMLGRTYADVGRYLPEIIETTIKLKLPPLQRALYDKVKEEYSVRWSDDAEQQKLIFNPASLLHPLRQITAQSGKFDAVEGILEDNNDKPAVIGFYYRDHAKMMYSRLNPKTAVLITGDMDAVDRQRLAVEAQNTGKHIVASQKSLSEGVNLYKYRMFIFGEESHVPGQNHQFLSRVVRDRNDDGLDREPVRVYYVHATATVDVHIHSVSKSRTKSINTIRELLELTLKKVA